MTHDVLCLFGALLFASTALHAATPAVFMAGTGSTVSIFDASSLVGANPVETAAIPYPGRVLSTVFSPDGAKAYVSTGTIYITDAVTHQITGTLPSNNARILAYFGTRLYAANADDSVWVYDPTTNAVLAKIPYTVHDASLYSPTSLQVSVNGLLIALSTVENLCGDDGCPAGDPYALVSVIDGNSNSVMHQFPVTNADSLAIASDNQTIYVATGSSILTFAVSNGAQTGSIAVNAGVLLMDGAAGRLYAGSSSGPGQVSLIATGTGQIAAQVNTPHPVLSLALNSAGVLYAAGCGLTDNNQFFPCAAAVIATGNMLLESNVPLFGVPFSLAVSPNKAQLWVGNASPNQVTVVNSTTNRVIGGAESDYAPALLAVLPNGTKFYASSPVSGTITAFDGSTFARSTILSASSAFNVVGFNAVSPNGARAYMVLNAVQVIDTATDQIVGTIADLPQSVAVSSDSQTIFTLDLGASTSIGAYSASTLQKLYSGTVGSNIPSRLLISPANNHLFVVGVTGIQIVSPNPIQVIMQIGQGCLDAGLSPDGSTLYCLTPASNSGAPVNVVAYNTTTGALTNTFPTGFFAPSGSIAITPDGASLFVSLETPVNSPGAVLEKIDVASGAISDANTPLYGMLAIQ